MKYYGVVLLSLFSINAYADSNALSAALNDPAWNGETIPEGQQCEKFGGNGMTPLLKVRQIPEEANALVMEYSDRSYQPMDNGGHGKFGYRIPDNPTSLEIPSVAGHTFDLPNGFFLIEAQRAPSWDKEGAYLPPCSGGKGNDYYVTIKAVEEVDGGIRKVLGETIVPLGKY